MMVTGAVMSTHWSLLTTRDAYLKTYEALWVILLAFSSIWFFLMRYKRGFNFLFDACNMSKAYSMCLAITDAAAGLQRSKSKGFDVQERGESFFSSYPHCTEVLLLV